MYPPDYNTGDSDTCCNGGMSSPCEPSCPRRCEEEARARESAQLTFRLDGFDVHSYGFEDEIPVRPFKKRRKKARSFKEAKTPSKHARAQDEEKTTYRRDSNMKITAIRYERVSSLGNYETERVAAEATVEANELPQSVLAELKTFVNDQLGIENMTAAEIAETERRLERAKRRRGF